MAKAKSIMIQGTMSNAGKSLLAGGLCRVFMQDGLKTTPFKSQNMALNSFITKEGLEMGRAQVMQAEAAGIEPRAIMNPILLKPTNDTGSQVIVNGEVYGTMSAMEYYRNKQQFVPAVLDAYHQLEDEFDMIVLEGAGSPAEINLKENDIVNMGMARMAKSPVLLAGDIDRGGVFAQLLGTVALLEPEEQAYIKGLIINKFRGDASILQPGIDMIEKRIGISVTGVVPYLYLDIDDEDSLTERFQKKDQVGAVDIAVIRLPRISNFTDFNAFECLEDVSLRYVSTPAQLGKPDIILIPGTKNTIEDLLWMRQNGLEAKIIQHASEGKIVFGVCGGYQMLGEEISDPDGMEHQGTVRGMGLLPTTTVFRQSKRRTRVHGTFGNVKGKLSKLSGKKLEGYEIHMGETELKSNASSLTAIINTIEDSSATADGAQNENVYGSYVHGIFDSDEVVKTIVASVLEEKGLDCSKVNAFQLTDYKEKQYDALAKAVRMALDMEQIYKIVDAGM